MKRIACFLLLAGCNRAFGLDDTQLADAAPLFFDAMPDAASVCADPSEPPRFDRELHQAVYTDLGCRFYQTSSVGLALAQCSPPATSQQRIYEGAVGPLGEMSVARGDLGSPMVVYGIALAPEGNEAFVAGYDIAAGIWRYQRDATGAWLRMEKLPITFAAGQLISTVTRGPTQRRLFVIESNYAYREWALVSGSWVDVGSYTAANFDLQIAFGIYLSPDGLRLMVHGYKQGGSTLSPLYTYRSSVDERFPPTVQLQGAPESSDLFMTEDCDRAYFSGLDAVFYVRRLP